MTSQRWAGVLAVLVVVAGAVLAWILLRDDSGSGLDTTSAESSSSTVASAGIKNAALEAAVDVTTKAYSYSWETLGDDRTAAREKMTSEMRRRYDRTMAGLGTSSQRDHTVVTAEVVDSALVTATPSYARVLLFVNQTTSDSTLDKPLLDLDRVLVTLVRDGGVWRLDDLDAL